MQRGEVQETMAGDKAGNGAPSASASSKNSRIPAPIKSLFRTAVERVSERIGERQIPKVLDRRERVKRELRAIPERMQKVTNQAQLVLELIDDYRDGTYREVPWRSLAVAAAALLYSVSPGDVIPDVIPWIGQIDDAFVLGLAMRIIQTDLEAYCRFKGYALEKYF